MFQSRFQIRNIVLDELNSIDCKSSMYYEVLKFSSFSVCVCDVLTKSASF